MEREYMQNEEFNDWFDELYPVIELAGCKYQASRVLFEIDPINYRCCFADHESLKEEEE